MKFKGVLILVLYFFLTIVAFSSLGVWLPLVFDHYDLGYISDESCKVISSNLITYSIVIFVTSLVDRVIQLFEKGNYTNNTIEFLVLILTVCGGGVYLTYKSIWFLNFGIVFNSIQYALYFTFLSWFLWFYVKTRYSGFKNYSSLGGDFS